LTFGMAESSVMSGRLWFLGGASPPHLRASSKTRKKNATAHYEFSRGEECEVPARRGVARAH